MLNVYQLTLYIEVLYRKFPRKDIAVAFYTVYPASEPVSDIIKILRPVSAV